MPLRMFSSVDLPQPDGPTTLTNSRPDTSNEAFSSAITVESSDTNSLRRLWTLMVPTVE